MRINNNNQNSFRSLYNNKYFLRGLEEVAKHGASFTAGTSFIMSVFVRPLAISMTPNVEKENKHYASISSLSSALIKLGIVEIVALPVENAIKKIDTTPQNYFSQSSLKFYQNGYKNIINSPKYRLGTQILKLGTGFITAIPKSMLTVALIPLLMDTIFNKKAYSAKQDNKSDLTFKGDKNFLSKLILKILNSQRYKNFLKANEHLEPDIAKHISASTDIILTSSYGISTICSQNINDDAKRPLIFNSIIGTAITILGGYPLDNLIKKKMQPFINKLIEANKTSTKLPKYLEGINVIRPALVFAAIYYIALPMLSIFLAEKTDKTLKHF